MTDTNSNIQNDQKSAGNQFLDDSLEWIYKTIAWPVAKENETDSKKRQLFGGLGLAAIFLCIYFGIDLATTYFSGSVITKIATIAALLVATRVVVMLIPILLRFLAKMAKIFWDLLLRFLKWLPTLFIWSAGADKETLDKGPKKEKIKYVGFGMSMFVPAILGFVTMTYVAHDIFKLSDPWIVGLLWAVIIFIVDRILVIGMQRNNKGKYAMGPMLLRLALAIIIGLVVATPIELMVFDREIQEQLAYEKETKYNIFDTELQAKKDVVDKKIATEEAKVYKLYESYKQEVDESIGGRKAGNGPEAKIKKAIWEEAKEKYENELKPSLLAEKQEIVAQIETKKSSWTETQAKGLGGRLEALNRTGERKPVIFYAHLVLWMFFLFLELVPVLVKWLMKPGSYEAAIKAEEDQMAVTLDTATKKIRNKSLEEEKTSKTNLQVLLEKENGRLSIERTKLEQERLAQEELGKAKKKAFKANATQLAEDELQAELITKKMESIRGLSERIETAQSDGDKDGLGAIFTALKVRKVEELKRLTLVS